MEHGSLEGDSDSPEAAAADPAQRTTRNRNKNAGYEFEGENGFAEFVRRE